MSKDDMDGGAGLQHPCAVPEQDLPERSTGIRAVATTASVEEGGTTDDRKSGSDSGPLGGKSRTLEDFANRVGKISFVKPQLSPSKTIGNLVKRGGAKARMSVMDTVANLNKSPQQCQRKSMAVLTHINECTVDLRDARTGDKMDLDVLFERETAATGMRVAVIDAGSPLHIILLRGMRLLALMNVIIMPYLLVFKNHFGGFRRPAPTSSKLWPLVLLDIVYGIGMFFQFLVSQVQTRTGQEIVSLSKIRNSIFQSKTFQLDVVSQLSVIVHLSEILIAEGGTTSWGIPLAQVRVLRGWRLLNNGMKGLLRSRPHHWKVVFEMADLVVITCILTHISACIWFITRGEPDADETSPYIQSIFETAFLMMGQERPRSGRNSDAERICTMILGLMGYMYMAYFLAQLFTAVGQQRVLETMIGQKMALVHAALTSLQIPKDLQKRIVRYHDFVNVHHSPEAYEALFGGLSVPLLTELKLCLFRDLIEKADFFQRCPPKQITKVVQELEELIYSPGDFVLRKGEVDAPAMFFIIRGQCELLGEGNYLIDNKSSGEYFGEVSLLLPEYPRACWARAKTYSIVARLSKDKFDEIFPSATQFRHVLENLLCYDWIDEETRESATQVLKAMNDSADGTRPSIGDSRNTMQVIDEDDGEDTIVPIQRNSDKHSMFQPPSTGRRITELGGNNRMSIVGGFAGGFGPSRGLNAAAAYNSGRQQGKSLLKMGDASENQDVFSPASWSPGRRSLEDQGSISEKGLEDMIRRIMKEELQSGLEAHQAEMRRIILGKNTGTDQAL